MRDTRGGPVPAEPLAAESPLRALANVYLSPHIAANSEQARERVHRMVADNLRLVLAGRPRLLLLDEPMAGMSQSESRLMTDLLLSL